MRKDIKGSDSKLLCEAIPSLRKILGVRMHRLHSCDLCDNDGDEDDWNIREDGKVHFLENYGGTSLTYLMRRVVTIISSIGDPIVCLIDDIQVRMCCSFVHSISQIKQQQISGAHFSENNNNNNTVGE